MSIDAAGVTCKVSCNTSSSDCDACKNVSALSNLSYDPNMLAYAKLAGVVVPALQMCIDLLCTAAAACLRGICP